jgi:hypothetical protein
VIVNIHIDSSIEYLGIPNMRKDRILRHGVPMEFDVTAGPDRDVPGDRLGFDACGRGKKYLEMLMPYGRIGSHGGWAHNKFAADIQAGRDSAAQVRALIDRNDRCLASVTGVPVRSFAAPVGVHPQPMMTNVLDSLGIVGYYYTGDTGAPVERPFFDGALVSSKSWAFPVMPLGNVASVGEMERDHISPAAVQTWMSATAEYAADQRGIYLLYSHSYDFLRRDYGVAVAHFVDRVEVLQRQGRLRTTNMVDAAAFMDRFVTTTSSFIRFAGGVHVHLENPRGLRSIAFAVPTAWINTHSLPPGVRKTGAQRNYTILGVATGATVFDVTLPRSSAK